MAKSDFLEELILALLFNDVAAILPPNLYVALHTLEPTDASNQT